MSYYDEVYLFYWNTLHLSLQTVYLHKKTVRPKFDLRQSIFK